MMMAVAAAFMCGCSNDGEVSEANVATDTGEAEVRFDVRGNFIMDVTEFQQGSEMQRTMVGRVANTDGVNVTRTALTDEANTMTDLWMFDFVGDECVQTLHLTPADADWGTPRVSLKYGSHHVYFVASRGTGATLDNGTHEIAWSRPSDTFWKNLTIDVNGSTNGTRTVELDRIATRLRVTATDKVPDDISTITITPSVWYNGVNYCTGEPCGVANSQDRKINVPLSYVGTSGQLAVSIYGFAGSGFQTNVCVTAKTADGTNIGEATVASVPFARNRSTELAGTLFVKVGVNTITIDDEWLDDYEMTF